MKRNVLIMLICFTVLAFSVEQVKSWEPPLEVDVVSMGFNYEAGYSNDALLIVKNASTGITLPEWYPASSRNNPCAYIKGQSNRRIATSFYHNQQPGDICSLHIRTTAAGYPPGTIAETQVNFPSCGVSASATLTMTDGIVTTYVHKFGFNYHWYINKVNGETLGTPIYMGVTGPHWYYILLAAPQAPMSVPWSDVLEYACAWAAGRSSESDALSKITEGAYNNLGITHDYDGTQTHAPGQTVYLTNLLNDDIVDCRDMSAVVQVFTRAIGGTSTQVRRINGGFYYKQILPIGYSDDDWVVGYWNFHQVGWKSNVYDACLKLNQSSPRIPVDENINDPYKNDLFNSGSWAPQSPSAFTTVY